MRKVHLLIDGKIKCNQKQHGYALDLSCNIDEVTCRACLEGKSSYVTSRKVELDYWLANVYKNKSTLN